MGRWVDGESGWVKRVRKRGGMEVVLLRCSGDC